MATMNSSKKIAIKKLIAKELPGWEVAEAVPVADSNLISPADTVGAPAEQVQRKYSKSVPIKRKGNGNLIRLKSTHTEDTRRGTKTAFVHDGKIVGLQG